jgi:hypothetical protein
VGSVTPSVSVIPGILTVPPGSPTETPTLTPKGGLMMLGNVTELRIGSWPVLTEVEPCLTPPTTEEMAPRVTELLTSLTELEDLIELFTGFAELSGLTEQLAALTELLGFTGALELLTAGLLEPFRVGIEMGTEMGSSKELLDLVEILALLVAVCQPKSLTSLTRRMNWTSCCSKGRQVPC